jgi:CHAT domain-containing protein/tetratricopeptide (TPR) repeat protein
MKAPSADAKRSIADVVNTVVSRFGLRIYASTLPKSTQIGNLSPQTVDLGRLRGYLCVVRKLLLILLLITAPTCAWSAQGGDVSADRPAEYMIYQYPGIDMVVKIDARETEFQSAIYGPEAALIKASSIPGRRIGPLYQFIDADDKPRQLMVKVSPAKPIDRSRIKLELIQLPEHDRNSAAFAHAYKLFSFGTEMVHSNDSTTWSSKTYTLRNAARAFASLGWEEMRLWSEYYAAHLVLFKLDDELMAMEMAQAVRRAARKAGFEDIEMAALLLESEALMKAGFSSTGSVAQARFEQAHGVLNQLIILTDELGFHSEQSRALFNDGLAFEQQGDLDQAIEQFERALDVSLAAGDSELANEIRSTAASAYETVGKTSGAMEMLESIGSDLAGDQVDEPGQELGANLFEQGRVLNDNYRYPEAAGVLSQALDIRRSRAAWGPTGLALAWSYYSMGEMDQAASLTQESIPRTTNSGHAAELSKAYDSLARIYRDKKQFQRMAEYREKQGELITLDSQRADFLFESANDAWRKEGPGSAEAGRFLSLSRSLARKTGNALAEHRAALYLCVQRMENNRADSCSAAEISKSHAVLQSSGIPRLALDASLARSKIRRMKGRFNDAMADMDQLIGELLFLRQTIPGVLGAWYWQSRTDIFHEFMSISLAQSGAGSRNNVDGRRVLLSLDRIRLIESMDRSGSGNPDIDTGATESLRVLLARREASLDQAAPDIEASINRELAELRNRFAPTARPVDSNRLNELLGGLAGHEAVLSYYFDRRIVYALIGSHAGVRLIKIPAADQILARLRDAHGPVGQGDPSILPDLETLGGMLLKPLSGLLPERIYLQSVGPLNGFPFDVLRLNGKFLAEQYQIVNLMSLAGLADRNVGLNPDFSEQVFLAGNPQSSRELFTYDIPASAEIGAVTDIFVGPGLHIVQGVALNRDEFSDQRFTGAGLIHLASPGTLDPAFPDRSRLRLSGGTGDPRRDYLVPPDIREFDFEANLVVLSGTAVTGVGNTPFDSGLGFISDFLDAGVHYAVATNWPVGDSETTRFVTDFYRRLESTRDVAEALFDTRMMRIESEKSVNFRSWAGFQLYIR